MNVAVSIGGCLEGQAQRKQAIGGAGESKGKRLDCKCKSRRT